MSAAAGIKPSDISAQVKLGLLSRESAQTKGRRYLIEGRLLIRHAGPGRLEAECRGQGETYTLGWDEGRGWFCQCPARVLCSHLVALQLVSTSTESGSDS